MPMNVPLRYTEDTKSLQGNVWFIKDDVVVAVCGDPYEGVVLNEQVLSDMLTKLRASRRIHGDPSP